MADSLTLLSFNINDIGDHFEQALKRLPLDERDQVTRYKFDKDRRLALASRLLRRYYYSAQLGIRWDCVKFTIQTYGKPALVHPHDGWADFNISHDGDWVIFGATEKTDTYIGVDVVSTNHDTYGPIDNYIASYHYQLTTEEIQLLKEHSSEEERLMTFYQIWGLKESYIKAVGKGLALELDHFCIMPTIEALPSRQQECSHDNYCHAQPTSRVFADTSAANGEKAGARRKFIARRLELRIKDDRQTRRVNNWCIHLGYLDAHSIAAVCCGSKNETTLLGDDLVQLGSTTLPLGEPFDHQPSIFTRISLATLLSSSS